MIYGSAFGFDKRKGDNVSNYITTYTGRHFEPAAPDPEMIRIEDIAHALSMCYRGRFFLTHFSEVHLMR